jgi:hypothetical protein
VTSQTNLFEHLDRTIKRARNTLSLAPNQVRRFAGDDRLHTVRRLVDQGARLAKTALQEPGPIDGPADDFCLPLIHRLVQIRHTRPDGGVFAFTSAAAGEGVGYVVESVAWELARRTHERILIASAASLSGPVSTHFHAVDGRAPGPALRQSAIDGTPKVWRLAQTFCESELIPPNPHTQSMDSLRRWFGYVLVESPAVMEVTPPFQVTSEADGVVLVVAAGQTKRDQIARAQELLDVASCNILGLILNKRTHPIPGFINKYL